MLDVPSLGCRTCEEDVGKPCIEPTDGVVSITIDTEFLCVSSFPKRQCEVVVQCFRVSVNQVYLAKSEYVRGSISGISSSSRDDSSHHYVDRAVSFHQWGQPSVSVSLQLRSRLGLRSPRVLSCTTTRSS